MRTRPTHGGCRLTGGVFEEVLVVPVDALRGREPIPAQRPSHSHSDQAPDIGCGVLIAQAQMLAHKNAVVFVQAERSEVEQAMMLHTQCKSVLDAVRPAPLTHLDVGRVPPSRRS